MPYYKKESTRGKCKTTTYDKKGCSFDVLASSKPEKINPEKIFVGYKNTNMNRKKKNNKRLKKKK